MFTDSHKFLYPKYASVAYKIGKHLSCMCVWTCVQRGVADPDQKNHKVSTFSKERLFDLEGKVRSG